MKLSAITIAAVVASLPLIDGFSPVSSGIRRTTTSMRMGYLDGLSPPGPGSWESYVEFNEFDGGDGQMGVAGDGNASLEKFDMSEMAKSKTMSAKNAWGKSTGYAESLVEQGMDSARAQQLENWHNQQEILQQRKSQRYMTDEFDQTSTEDDNWRNLASFGVERTQVSVR
jgi:hypothetical protein